MATETHFALGSFLILLLPVLFGLWLVVKISVVSDQYHLRDELTNGFKVIVITMVIYLLLYLIIYLPTEDEQLISVFFTIVEIISIVVLCFFCTKWVIGTLDKMRDKSQQDKAINSGKKRGDESDSEDGEDDEKEDRGGREHNKKKKKKTKPKSLRELVRDKEGFNIFMNHLVKFSVFFVFLSVFFVSLFCFCPFFAFVCDC